MDNIEMLKIKVEKLEEMIDPEPKMDSDSVPKREKYYYSKFYYAIRNLKNFFDYSQTEEVFVVSNEYLEERSKKEEILNKLEDVTGFIKSSSSMLNLYDMLITVEKTFQEDRDPYKFERQIKRIYNKYSSIDLDEYMDTMIHTIISSYHIRPDIYDKEITQGGFIVRYKKILDEVGKEISLNKSNSEFFESTNLKTLDFNNKLGEILDYFLGRTVNIDDKEYHDKLEFFYEYATELYDYQSENGYKINNVKKYEKQLIDSNKKLCEHVSKIIKFLIRDYYDGRLNVLENFFNDLHEMGRMEDDIYNKYIMFIYKCCDLFKTELDKYDIDKEDKDKYINGLSVFADDVANFYKATNCKNIEDFNNY